MLLSRATARTRSRQLMDVNNPQAHLTCENAGRQDGTGSLIYFYSSCLNADNGSYVK